MGKWRDVYRQSSKQWTKIQREKKKFDKANKRLERMIERASRPKDYSGRKIKKNVHGEECQANEKKHRIHVLVQIFRLNN